MKFEHTLIALSIVVVVGGCQATSGKLLTVEERQLIDARHDLLRCQVYIDRLRDLYNVTDTEPDGLMDDKLDVGTSPGDQQPPPIIGGADGPLVGNHDGPLTGNHDAPLVGGHDDPLTGNHDAADIDDLREAVMLSAAACWDASDRLVSKYNSCIADFVECRNDGGSTCYADYLACLEDKRLGN